MNVGRPPNGSVDDGLLMSALDMIGEPPGTYRTQYELAEYCGVSHQRIQQIEYGAIRKLRKAMRLTPSEMRDLRGIFTTERTPAQGWRHEGHIKAASEPDGGMEIGDRISIARACDAFWRARGLGEFCV